MNKNKHIIDESLELDAIPELYKHTDGSLWSKLEERNYSNTNTCDIVYDEERLFTSSENSHKFSNNTALQKDA